MDVVLRYTTNTELKGQDHGPLCLYVRLARYEEESGELAGLTIQQCLLILSTSYNELQASLNSYLSICGHIGA